MIKYLKPAIFLLIGLVLGFFINKITTKNIPTEETQKVSYQKDVRDGEGKFTNPLLECAQSENVFSELKPFKISVQELVDSLESKPEINKIAVYFRDLNNGPWFGVDDQMPFSPASLLKVPLSIAFYKIAERDPTLLAKQITYTGNGVDQVAKQTIKPSETLEPGKSYTVEDLIYRMLVYSDNLAYELLISNIDIQDLTDVYKDFGFNIQDFKKSEEIVNIQNYSSFFRILYNSSYLNKEYSEKILSTLSQSDFKTGLVSTLPDTLPVAHKFGERGIRNSDQRQFSDCGIIYYPEKPYLLCIATKGTDFVVQSEAIGEISALVYKNIKEQK